MASPQKYTIDNTEIDRRKQAFSSFLLFLFIGISFSLKLLLGLSYFPLFVSMGILASVLFMSRFLTYKAFEDISKTVVTLTDEYIERIGQKGGERINLCDIDKISIKMTAKKSIRELGIATKDTQLGLNGIANFDNLSEVLLSSVSQKTKVVRTQEPIDYDSKYFYPILGLIMGGGTIISVKFLINSYHEFARAFLSSFMVFVIGLGVYFIYTKPATRGNGLRFQPTDRVMGIMFITLGIALLYLILTTI